MKRVFLLHWALLVTMVIPALPITGVPQNVAIRNGSLLVAGNPFRIRGVGYSPVPVGVDPDTAPPHGDYYTADYRLIYERDLPLLRHLGANTIRLWAWNNTADHTNFLDQAYNNGIQPVYVIATFWMGTSLYPDISSPAAREQIKEDFRQMVANHKNHPAILMWCIGNELNTTRTYGEHLDQLFSLLNEMAQVAHLEEGDNYHPVTTALVDIDVLNTIATYNDVTPSLDAWGVNLYRGLSFGTFFEDYATVSDKPLVILEYGIDAYDDMAQEEYELIGPPYQAIYAAALWQEIVAHPAACLGGTIMAYSDEWWKGKYGEVRPGCPESDPAFHSDCGYPTAAHPDGYSNEEWWGIMRTVDNGTQIDQMQPRAVYFWLRQLWVNPVYLPMINKPSP